MNINDALTAYNIRACVVREEAAKLTDETALTVINLFEKWRVNTPYTAGDRYRHEGALYRCIQSHTSQADWTPDKTPALWTVVSLDEWPEWVQPTGAQDAYALNAKVSHKGDHWTSDYDNNTWEPSVFGWSKVK